MPAEAMLTEDMQAQICLQLEQGQTRAHAAESAGVHKSTLNRWLKKAKDEPDGPFASFASAIKKAEAQAAAERVERIRQAGVKGTWQADAWWLERRCPEDYALRERRMIVELLEEVKAMRDELRNLKRAKGNTGLPAGGGERNGRH